MSSRENFDEQEYSPEVEQTEETGGMSTQQAGGFKVFLEFYSFQLLYH